MIEFWERYPALLIGIFIFLGTQVALQPDALTGWLVLIPVAALFSQPRLSVCIALLIGVGAFYYTHITKVCLFDEGSLRGSAVVEVIDVKEEMKYGKPHIKMRVHIESFRDEEGHIRAKNVQASHIWKGKGMRPQGGILYEIKGTLKKNEGGWVSLYPSSKWTELESRFSLVEWRINIKKRLGAFFEQRIPQSAARTFLQGLFLGEFHDPILAENLRRFGLSHIMVVSGFHFSLMVAFLAFFLRFTLPWKASLIGLLMGATFYLIFIGPTASVMRAWISVTVLFMGKFFEKRASGLNSLGVALIAQLLYEPAWCQSLGFQLSFLATFAILLFYQPFDDLFARFFKTRALSAALEMSLIDQITYVLMIFFRKSMALSFAVNILMLPMSLYYFHQFPGLSLFYNIFFPILTSICLFLLCLSLFFSWIPILSTSLFWMTYNLTCVLLKPVNFLPRSFDMTLQVYDMPASILVLLLTGTIVAGILLHTRSKSPQNSLFNYV